MPLVSPKAAWGIYHNHQPPAGAQYGDIPQLEVAYNHVYLIVTDQLHLGAPSNLGGPDSADSSDLVDPNTGAVHNANAARCLEPARIARGTIFVIGINCVTNGAVSQHPGFSSSYAAVAGGLYNAQVDLWADALLAYKAKGVAQIHALFQLEPSNTAQPGPKGSADEYVAAFALVWQRFQNKGVQAAGIRLGWDSDGANWRVPNRTSPEAFDWEPAQYNLCSADYYPTKSTNPAPRGQTFSFGLGDNDGGSPGTGFLHNAAVNHPGIPVLIRSMCPKMVNFGGDFTDASAAAWFLDAAPQLLAIPDFMGVAWDHNNVQLDTVMPGPQTYPNYTIVPQTKTAFHNMAPAYPTDISGGANVPPVHPVTVAGVASVKAPTILVNKSVVVTPAKVTTIAAVPAPTVVVPVKPATVAAVVTVFGPTLGAGTKATPAAVAAIASVKAPTILTATASTATPATVVATAAVPAPTVTLTGSATPTPVTVVAIGLPRAPTIHASALVTPSTVTAVAVVPAISVAVVLVAPVTVVGVATVPLATVHATGVPHPSTVAAVAGVNAPTISNSRTVTPSVVVAVAAVPAPSILRGVTVTPAAVGAVAAVPAPSIRRTALVTPAVVVATASVKVPSIITNSQTNVAVLTVVGHAAVPAPSFFTSPSFVAPEVTAFAAVPAPNPTANALVFHPQFVKAVGRTRPIGGPVTALAGATATPSAVAAIATVGAPTVASAPTPTPSAVVALGVVPAVTLVIDSNATPVTVSASAAVNSPTAQGNTAPAPSTVAAIGAVIDPNQVKGSARPHAPVVVAIGAVPAPVVSVSPTVTPNVVTAFVHIVPGGVEAGGDTQAPPDPVDLTVVIPDVEVTLTALVEATSVDAVMATTVDVLADAAVDVASVDAPSAVNVPDFTTETLVDVVSVDAVAAVPDPAVFEVLDTVVAVEVVACTVAILSELVTVNVFPTPATVLAIAAVLLHRVHIVRHVDSLYAQILSDNDPYGTFSTNDPYEDIERRTA